MKMKIKQYEYVKKEIASKEIELPKTVSYYFETGIRRSIKIIPHFTTWNKERFNKDEELYELEIICLYNSFKCKLEKFTIRINQIEEIYYSKHPNEYQDFVTPLINGWFDKRTEEQFNNDLKNILNQIK